MNSTAGTGPSRFTITLPGSVNPAQDVFELWQPTSPPATTAEIGSLWRADLPLDPGEAFLLLEQRQSSLRLGRQALPDARNRLEQDLNMLAAATAPGASFSFSIEEPGSPRSILTAALVYQQPGLGAGAGQSFGIFDDLKIDPFHLEEAARSVARFAEQVRRTVDQFALVETAAAGQRFALTRAAWSGDVETWWASSATSAQRLQHEHVLAQALATRQGWLRFLLTAAAGITKVAVTLAAAPFSPIAIWTAWNYLQAVVKQYKQIPAAPG